MRLTSKISDYDLPMPFGERQQKICGDVAPPKKLFDSRPFRGRGRQCDVRAGNVFLLTRDEQTTRRK